MDRSGFKETAKGIQTYISHSTVFKNSLYEAQFVTLSDPGPDFVCLCVTFRVHGKENQFIVSTWAEHNTKQFRGILASQDLIRVWGTDDRP